MPWICLLAALILLAGAPRSEAAAAAAKGRRAAAAPVDVMAALHTLARQRSRQCAAGARVPQPPGWQGKTAECAWQDRLQMRRWEALPAVAAGCLSQQARWWQWQQARQLAVPPESIGAWDGAWRSQSLRTASDAQQRISVIARAPAGTWTATEWTWIPSPRPATRKWQEGRWKLLAQAASALRGAAPAPDGPHMGALRETWEKNLAGRAGEVLADGWRWEDNGLCLRMETAGLSQAQLHLPYSRDEVRHEQHAAMQLQLARRFPKATWLMPFRALPVKDADQGAGAKYAAVWLEDKRVKGQLWIPTKTDGAIVRARIIVEAPATAGKPPPPALVKSIGTIERELAALASIWESDHE
ncbi:hypothetical protein [Massilia glaciei]|uniref:Uncharacterized protein n=1 Tax=Massilia glaciei TaxID=1524097 RepID=A0A2U2H9W9_9BURK|nr:hypothetical protein [Massilia glaciei]PWF39454.1 hypothetical protein C7C56_027025 [Massilia glaciei]